MIGRLRGRMLEKKPPLLLLEVGGVGYEIEAPMSTFYQLPSGEQEITLHTHLLVREDAQLLFGFASRQERELFRALIRVKGVGARMALTLLSGMSADEFARVLQEDDAASLTRLPGIGKKTAERLLVEMRDRVDDWQQSGVLPVVLSGGADGAAAAGEIDGETDAGRRAALHEALGALVALGYRAAEAGRMVSAVPADIQGVENIIREALRGAMKK